MKLETGKLKENFEEWYFKNHCTSSTPYEELSAHKKIETMDWVHNARLEIRQTYYLLFFESLGMQMGYVLVSKCRVICTETNVESSSITEYNTNTIRRLIEKFNTDDNRIEVELKYVGIDRFNRPVFKTKDNIYYGSVMHLFPHEEKVIEVMSKIGDVNNLEYFGRTFGCEPNGGQISPNYKLVLVEKFTE